MAAVSSTEPQVDNQHKPVNRSPRKRCEVKRDRVMGLLLHLQPNLSYPVMNHAQIGQRADLVHMLGMKRMKSVQKAEQSGNVEVAMETTCEQETELDSFQTPDCTYSISSMTAASDDDDVTPTEKAPRHHEVQSAQDSLQTCIETIDICDVEAEERETENIDLVVLPKDMLTCADTSSAEKQEVVAESVVGISLDQLTVAETGSSEEQEIVAESIVGISMDQLTVAETGSSEEQEIVAESTLDISLDQLAVAETGSSEKQEAVPDCLSGSRQYEETSPETGKQELVSDSIVGVPGRYDETFPQTGKQELPVDKVLGFPQGQVTFLEIGSDENRKLMNHQNTSQDSTVTEHIILQCNNVLEKRETKESITSMQETAENDGKMTGARITVDAGVNGGRDNQPQLVVTVDLLSSSSEMRTQSLMLMDIGSE